ncbi:MAG TPA: BtrH N-terminal domain-containing protein, partial [Vicinamibacteria bacterium]
MSALAEAAPVAAPELESGGMRERFQHIHSPGRDCRLTCARDLLDYFGLRYSHSVVQGLSSACLFSYARPEDGLQALLYPELDFRGFFSAVSGGVLEILENLAYLFNGRYLVRQQDPADLTLQELRPYLAEGIPVLVAVCRDVVYDHLGLFYPPWPSYLGPLKFGGHFMPVVGIDDARGVVQMFETNRLPPLELPFEVLHRARTQGDGEADYRMQSLNRWAVFVPSPAPPPLPALMRTALLKTVHAMTDSASARAGASGLPALERFCRELPHWAERMTRDHYQASLFMLRLNSVELSTGAMGRKGFGIFLRRAAVALGQPELEPAAHAYAEAAEAWQDLLDLIDDEVLDPESTRV